MRYQINVGDDFPLGERRGGCGGRGRAMGLKALFFISLAAIAISHPVPAALVLGSLLLLARSGMPQHAYARWQRGGMRMRQHDWPRAGREPGAFV